MPEAEIAPVAEIANPPELDWDAVAAAMTSQVTTGARDPILARAARADRVRYAELNVEAMRPVREARVVALAEQTAAAKEQEASNNRRRSQVAARQELSLSKLVDRRIRELGLTAP